MDYFDRPRIIRLSILTVIVRTRRIRASFVMTHETEYARKQLQNISICQWLWRIIIIIDSVSAKNRR